MPAGATTRGTSARSSASSGSSSSALRSRREDEDELLGSQADSSEGVGNVEGVRDAELAGAGFDQAEEVVAVLWSGKVDADARVVPSEFADHLSRRVGGQSRQAG